MLFDMGKIRDLMDVGVRRASSFMALGLRNANDETIQSVRLDSSFAYLFMADPLTREQSTEVRGNFGKWVIGNGLRELYQLSATFFDQLYAALVTASVGGRITAELRDRWQRMEDETSVSAKARKIAREFDIVVPNTEHLSGLSHARNALTHNLGRVGKRHTNEGEVLRVTWVGLDIVFGSVVVSGPFEQFEGAGQHRQFGKLFVSEYLRLGMKLSFHRTICARFV